MTRAAAPAFLALLVGATPARAEDEGKPTVPDAPARLRLEGTVGVGTPVGWAGAEILGRIHPRLTLHGGAGFASQGVHVTAGVRALVTKSGPRDGVSLGASWSSGEFAGVPSSSPPFPEMGRRYPRTYWWERAHFVNIEINAEHEAWMRSFIGLGFVVNGGDATVANRCTSDGACGMTLARLVPYFGLAFSFGVL